MANLDMEGSQRSSKVPRGILLISKLCKSDPGLHEHRMLVLLLTFVAYACFHASRKPLSVVKSVLDPEAPHAEPPGGSFTPIPSTPALGFGWVPFNDNFGKARLGELDVAFLATYAAGMYYAGALGDRLDLRIFLTFGMVSSGVCVCLFGFGYWWNVHSFWYYFIVQIMTGLLSSIGWPVVVAIVANWFGKTKRGLIMGIWNAHGSVGNITGSIVAAAALQFGWGWSFLFPGLAIILCSVLVYFLLVVEPKNLGLPSPYEDNEQMTSLQDEERKVLITNNQLDADASGTNGRPDLPSQLGSNMQLSFEVERAMNGSSNQFEEFRTEESHGNGCSSDVSENVAVQFYEAWNIPGVALYAFCLFFVKLVAYTFLFWLPFYIRHTEIGGEFLSDRMAGYLSTIFDFGGVFGGIAAGHLSDKYEIKATAAVLFIYCAVPSLYAFRSYGGKSVAHAVCLMIVSGIFVNGPYALITTAVSADLGSPTSLKGNAKALATVTAIIDGTGSIGAALGPFLTGYLATTSWTAVFIMLAISLLIAGLFLTKMVIIEIKEKLYSYNRLTMEEVQPEN